MVDDCQKQAEFGDDMFSSEESCILIAQTAFGTRIRSLRLVSASLPCPGHLDVLNAPMSTPSWIWSHVIRPYSLTLMLLIVPVD